MKLLRTDRTVLLRTCTSTRKGLACMRMKLYSNHMRRRVSLYVLYRTEWKNKVAELATFGGAILASPAPALPSLRAGS
jgi:hypothetical protein